MPIVLEAYPFNLQGRPVKYAWDKLSDGGIYRLVRGVDFHERLRASSLRVAARYQAQKRGLRVRTAVDGDDVIVQFYKVAE